MSLISEEYRKQNKGLHESNKHYGTSGENYAGQILSLANAMQTADILDYGCGKGTLNSSIRIQVKEYDPAITGKDEAPEPADLVVCTDVLEHIEPEYLEAVLDDLKRLSKQAVFVTVATVPAFKTLPDGRNAHLIVENTSWWLPKLIERWEMTAFQSVNEGFIFVGVVR